MAKKLVSADRIYRWFWVVIVILGAFWPAKVSAGQTGWRSPAENPPASAQLWSPQAQTESLPAGAPETEWKFHKTDDNVHPDGREQQVLWLMNRARQNPAAEGEWLASSDDFEISGPRAYFGVDLDMLVREFAGYVARPPAAFDVRLYNAAKAHSEDLIRRDAQDHTGQFERIGAAGFACSGGRGNVYSYASSALNAHAAWDIDWGPGPGGMQADRGHRQALIPLEGDFTNAGIALVFENNPKTQVGPYVATGNYCNAGAVADHYNRFLVGTVWRDLDRDAMYDPGEGMGGVTVTPSSGAYYAVTANSGGYALPLTQSGPMEVTFSGKVSGVSSITVGEESLLLDFVLQPAADLHIYLPLTIRP